MNTEHQLKSKLTSVQKVWTENESGTGTMTRTKNAVFIGLFSGGSKYLVGEIFLGGGNEQMFGMI